MADQLQITRDLVKIAADLLLIYIDQLYGNINYIPILPIKADLLQIMAIVLPRFSLAWLGSAQESSSKIGHAEPSQTVTSRLSGAEPLGFLLR